MEMQMYMNRVVGKSKRAIYCDDCGFLKQQYNDEIPDEWQISDNGFENSKRLCNCAYTWVSDDEYWRCDRCGTYESRTAMMFDGNNASQKYCPHCFNIREKEIRYEEYLQLKKKLKQMEDEFEFVKDKDDDDKRFNRKLDFKEE